MAYLYCRKCNAELPAPYDTGAFTVHEIVEYCFKDFMDPKCPKCGAGDNYSQGEFQEALATLLERALGHIEIE